MVELEGWVLAFLGRHTLIGQHVPPISGDTLRAPACLLGTLEIVDIATIVQPAPNQPPLVIGAGFSLRAFCGFESLDRVPLPSDAVTIKLTSLSEEDQRVLWSQIQATEKAKLARKSNLVIAPPGTKLPPMRKQ